MKRPRRRLVLRISACAAVGAAVTVAVAWGCATALGSAPYREDARAEWPAATPRHWPTKADASWRADFGSAEVRGARNGPGSRDGIMVRMDVLLAGWPWLSMRCDEFAVGGRAPVIAEHGTRGAWRAPRWLSITMNDVDPLLPLIPLWPGFALDTALYGLLAFLLWSAPGFIRRTRRRRRGQCLACGYELKGITKCPECGGEA